MAGIQLDVIEKEKNVSLLSNGISDCMIANNMTLEHLELACDVVRDVYKKNATIKKAD